MIGVMPSRALTPIAPACGGRIPGAAENCNSGFDPCALWQSTQLACRLLFSSGTSAASWKVLPEGKGWLPFATSAMMFEIDGHKYVPPPWQIMQFWVTASSAGAAGDAGRSNRAGATESCVIWHDVQAFTPTVA